ncbi:hypothetical protein EDC96DRAFT_544452 [Choanephora cucurbitarum]|nr:hypothetical protein EDC96DRAFT_544452 [Choanephora cucurbitarum]
MKENQQYAIRCHISLPSFFVYACSAHITLDLSSCFDLFLALVLQATTMKEYCFQKRYSLLYTQVQQSVLVRVLGPENQECNVIIRIDYHFGNKGNGDHFPVPKKRFLRHSLNKRFDLTFTHSKQHSMS